MKFQKILIFLLCLAFSQAASAQFYVTGDDPGHLKWNYMDTESYRIIYPRGLDSLARVYGRKLETYKIPVSRTTGYVTGEGDGKLMPVMLHAWNTSNGSVAWAPKRMDLFTIPSAYAPEAMPWSTMLSVHESRHVTQMQFGMTNSHKPLGWVFGQMWNILASIIYPNMYNIEGDAVVAETALTPAGRGRTSDFLNYYQVAFDQGDYRNWCRWHYGSQKYYTPDYYSLGYMNLAGLRHLYNCPTYMNQSYEKASRKVLDIRSFHKVRKQITGKGLKGTFMEICDTMQAIWSREAFERAPFMPSEPVSREYEYHIDFRHSTFVGDDLYAVRKGFLYTPQIVRIDSMGKVKKVAPMAYETSRIQHNDGKIWWSETSQDERWSMETKSLVRYADLGHKGDRRSFSKRKNLLYNPDFTSGEITAVRYRPDGRYGVVILAEDGSVNKEFDAPDGLQPIQAVCLDDVLYISAISEEGYGIYRTNVNYTHIPWMTVLAPQPVKVKDLDVHEGCIIFTCDRTGVNELYHLDPRSGNLTQKTSTRYGASDFRYSPDGEWLYYSSQTLQGMRIFRTSTDSLFSKPVNFSDTHKYVLADAMAEQETAIAQKEGSSAAVEEKDVQFSEPKKYSKAGHMFYIHSWAPVYVSVDKVMNMSFDHIWQAASLGATAIMQNRLATGVGEFGYSAHKDPYDKEVWRHSGHFKFTYSGLYPVFEISADINDRSAMQYYSYAYKSGDRGSIGVSYRFLDTPAVQGKLKTYIPFNFSSGGWYRGFIPQLTYTISNDRFNTSIPVMNRVPVYSSDANGFLTETYNLEFMGENPGKNSIRQILSGSVRGYTMLGTPNSAVYPRWGIGAEAGISGSLGEKKIFSPMGYGYLYGYVPGILREQGIKLTAMHQIKLSPDSYFSQAVLNILPRGFSRNSSLLSTMSIQNNSITKFTIDYAAPIFIGDIGIGGGLFYIKRLTLSPHFDFSTTDFKTGLFSVGTEFVFDLNSILWLRWPCSIGATYSWNGGLGQPLRAFEEIYQTNIDRNHVGFVFNVSF